MLMRHFKHYIENFTKFDLTSMLSGDIKSNLISTYSMDIMCHNYGIMVLDMQNRFMLRREK